MPEQWIDPSDSLIIFTLRVDSYIFKVRKVSDDEDVSVNNETVRDLIQGELCHILVVFVLGTEAENFQFTILMHGCEEIAFCFFARDEVGLKINHIGIKSQFIYCLNFWEMMIREHAI